ncbi:MAG: hypothetical protein M5R36_18765 [Deltaproteobacteria bacterium]|nr:hypothetical protein [Deltaproteobacteria bacterium]
MKRPWSVFVRSMIVFVVLHALLSSFACDGGDDASSSEATQDDDTDDDDSADALDDDTTLDDDVDDDALDDDTVDVIPARCPFAPEPSDAVGVFVAKTGDDANPGTMAAPMLTVAAAVVKPRRAEGPSSSPKVCDEEEIAVGRDVRGLFGGYEAETWLRDLDLRKTVVKSTVSNGTSVEGGDYPDVAYLEGLEFVGRETEGDEAFDYADALSVERGSVIISCCRSTGGHATHRTTGVDASSTTLLVLNSILEGGVVSEFGSATGLEAHQSSTLVVNSVVVGGLPGSSGSSHAIESDDPYSFVVLSSYLHGGWSDGPPNSSRAVGIGNVKFYTVATLANNVIDGGRAGDSKAIVTTHAALILTHNDIWEPDGDCLVWDLTWAPICYRTIKQLEWLPDVFVAWGNLQCRSDVPGLLRRRLPLGGRKPLPRYRG